LCYTSTGHVLHYQQLEKQIFCSELADLCSADLQICTWGTGEADLKSRFL
jgi:hypothetical protein